MSYMDDDRDPFGIPYGDSSDSSYEEEQEYTLQELEILREKLSDLESEVKSVSRKKEKAIEQLTKKLKRYVPFSEITYGESVWIIIVEVFEFKKLEALKSDLNLKDMRVECIEEKINGKYKNKIKITIYPKDLE